MASKTHKDLEFAVDDPSGRERIFKKFDEAAAYAVTLALSDGSPHHVDVLIHSAAAAKFWGGEDAVQQYEDDPDASVSQRIEVRADDRGRVY